MQQRRESPLSYIHTNKTLGKGLLTKILKEAGIDKDAVLRKDQKAGIKTIRMQKLLQHFQ